MVHITDTSKYYATQYTLRNEKLKKGIVAFFHRPTLPLVTPFQIQSMANTFDALWDKK